MKMVFMTAWQSLSTVAALGMLLFAAACGSPSGTSVHAGPSGTLNIVVAFYPFQFIAERLVGSAGAVRNLTEPGAEPHDVELSPRQVAEIADADLVIYEHSFQPGVDAAVEEQNGDHILDTTTVVPLQALEETQTHPEGG